MGKLTIRPVGRDNMYSNGTYSVRISPEGFIEVKPGDWLSKYSAAIYDNFTTLGVFYELDDNGRRKTITNKNLIRAGETLVWWDEDKGGGGSGGGGSPGATPSSISRDKFLQEMMAKSNLRGNRLQGLMNAADRLSDLENGLSLTEILGSILTVGKESGVVAVAGSAAETLSGINLVLGFVTGVIAWANALEEGLRNVGICAIAFGATAWAYSEMYKPPLPKVFEDNLNANYGKGSQKANWEINKSRAAWSESIYRTATNLEKQVAESGKPKEATQAWVMAMGGTPVTAKNTCYALWEGLSHRIPAGSRRDTYMAIVPDYPTAFAMTRNR